MFGTLKRGGYQVCDPQQLWIVHHEPPTSRWGRRSRVMLECCVCGTRVAITVPSPRLLPIGEHPHAARFRSAHTHPARPHPGLWHRPIDADTLRLLATPR